MPETATNQHIAELVTRYIILRNKRKAKQYVLQRQWNVEELRVFIQEEGISVPEVEYKQGHKRGNRQINEEKALLVETVLEHELPMIKMCQQLQALGIDVGKLA